ncbi:PREDICTED: uncharacterized protein LOC108370278 isoform X2 [Rhagoletis zephyria]|uniref:uncharacterized protein LOC108370278 isoform X2 n=1 Tax=Rhagoletis zephyria TaxID=28612 RepID=UPI000811A803|nr:PREDICTED: uncharacterized protein LOC108370278 isoform X2 [Rhagoletis zephyria]
MGNSASATRNEQAIPSSKQRQQQESIGEQELGERIHDKKLNAEKKTEPQHQNGSHINKFSIHRTRSKSSTNSKKPEEYETGLRSEGQLAANTSGTQRTRQLRKCCVVSPTGTLSIGGH